MYGRSFLQLAGAASALVASPAASLLRGESDRDLHVRHLWTSVDGLRIFSREAGSVDDPAILMLHGLPTSWRIHGISFPRSPAAPA
jgi:hypothetical protein